MTRTTFAYIPSSHLDLYWLGSYRTCLERGASLIEDYLDRCLANPDETFLLETVVFAEYFLERHPDYREHLAQLIREGRVEIGTVFVDRWEHLILGESHIRNIQIGTRWSGELLGHVNPLVTHPDLPGLVAQTSQIYRQAGVEYYVTSRKLYADGAVWRHRSPDGTDLTYLNWPRHYIYYPLAADDLPNPFDWIRRGIDIAASERMFPEGVIPINAGAGDLTNPVDFRNRYGASLQDLIAANREKYPQYDFIYSVPGAVLAPYADRHDLPVLEGDIPSVWGVACDEEVAFFRRNRQSEYQLLAAEALAVVLEHLGFSGIPETAGSWQGRFYESAFYARKDPIPAGEEFAELWKMHIFSEDHNGGGYEGALSTFQKRVMQDRVLAYTGQILEHGLGLIAESLSETRPGILVFNSLGQAWNGGLTVAVPTPVWNEGLRPVDDDGVALQAQVVSSSPESTTVVVALRDIPPVGYRFLPLAPTASGTVAPSRVAESTGSTLSLETDGIAITVDTTTGAVTNFWDRQRGTDWGRTELGTIRAIRESGNDVTLRIAPDAEEVHSDFLSASIDTDGPIFSSIRIERRLLGNLVDQIVSLWHDGHVEFETRVRWSGAHNWQLRLALPTTGASEDVAYGSPFYGSGWTDITAEVYPRNNDEVLVEDYHRYREVQEWLHLRQGESGLLVATTHPGFCFIDRGLEAVLLRTSPSCGDTRYYWENAGEQMYRFAFYPMGADWRGEGAIAQAQRHLRQPVSRYIDGSAAGSLQAARGFLTVDSPSAILSSLSRNVATEDVDIRIFEARGIDTQVALSGPLITSTPVQVDLLGRNDDLANTEQRIVPAWRIQTYAIEPPPSSSTTASHS